LIDSIEFFTYLNGFKIKRFVHLYNLM